MHQLTREPITLWKLCYVTLWEWERVGPSLLSMFHTTHVSSLSVEKKRVRTTPHAMQGLCNPSYTITQHIVYREVSFSAVVDLCESHNEAQWDQRDHVNQAAGRRNSKNTFIFILIATVSHYLSFGAVIPLTFACNARLNNMDPRALLMDQCCLQIADL